MTDVAVGEVVKKLADLGWELPREGDLTDHDLAYLRVMVALIDGPTVEFQVRADACELLSHVMAAFKGRIPQCAGCLDETNVKVDGGNWVRCPECR